MRLFLLAAVFCTFATFGLGQEVRYDGYKLVNIVFDSVEKLKVAEYLKKLPYFDVWGQFENDKIQNFEVMLGPRELRLVKPILTKSNITFEILQENIQEIIDTEQIKTRATRDQFDWTSYKTLDEINAWVDSMTSQYSSIITPFVVGKSYEGRDIRGIKISYKTGNSGVFIESNIHAREWITSATATYFINELLTSKDAAIRNIAESVDWYIIPVFNVDGFVYSHEKNRLWRKTRKPTSNPECPGADPNRNFDSHWMENGGATGNPCDETYGGSEAFSEPECEALKNYLVTIKDKIGVYLAYHSYGQYILSPYGHTKMEFPDNYEDMQSIARSANEAIKSTGYGQTYRYGSTATILYIASGSSVDYVYNELGVRISYTFEFRDQGKWGFVLPSSHIITNAKETVAAMVALVRESKNLGYL